MASMASARAAWIVKKKTLSLVRYHLSQANKNVSGPENMQILEMFIDLLSKNQCI